jgi:hypothetical protein
VHLLHVTIVSSVERVVRMQPDPGALAGDQLQSLDDQSGSVD